jgi:hypothetical protein
MISFHAALNPVINRFEYGCRGKFWVCLGVFRICEVNDGNQRRFINADEQNVIAVFAPCDGSHFTAVKSMASADLCQKLALKVLSISF